MLISVKLKTTFCLLENLEIFRQAFDIPQNEQFVIVTTNRQEILDDKTYGERVVEKLINVTPSIEKSKLP